MVLSVPLLFPQNQGLGQQASVQGTVANYMRDILFIKNFDPLGIDAKEGTAASLMAEEKAEKPPKPTRYLRK